MHRNPCPNYNSCTDKYWDKRQYTAVMGNNSFFFGKLPFKMLKCRAYAGVPRTLIPGKKNQNDDPHSLTTQL